MWTKRAWHGTPDLSSLRAIFSLRDLGILIKLFEIDKLFEIQYNTSIKHRNLDEIMPTFERDRELDYYRDSRTDSSDSYTVYEDENYARVDTSYETLAYRHYV